MSSTQENNTHQNNTENETFQHSEDVSAEDTAKISRVTEEMIQKFSDTGSQKKIDDEKSEDEDSQETFAEKDIDDEPSDDESSDDSNNDEEKTIVEFIEDETEQNVKKKKERKPFFVLKICLSLFIIFLLTVAVWGIWNRWFRYDDKAQIISNWQISGTQKTVAIDDKKIVLDQNAVLTYTVDEQAKIINYQIGDMGGSSHYRFSWDRNQLALIENSGTDSISTMLVDIAWFWDYITCKMAKVDLSPAYTKNNINEVNTDNTGIEDIISNGQNSSILLDRVSTKKTDET